MFKIVLDPGHGINTAGKRCSKLIDPNETREWVLNSRISNYITEYLSAYTGYSLHRVDDITGKVDVPLATRVKNANQLGADIFISLHHNAAANNTKAGGIVCYSYTQASKASNEWRDELYKALIKNTGLKGNRSQPLLTANFYVLKYTKMPAVLLELGFMDSLIDTPIILTDSYAQKCAKAIVEVIVKRGKLKKKVTTKAPETTTPSSTSTSNAVKYRVQVGAFKVKANAENLKNKLKAAGFNTIIVCEDGKHKVQVGAFKVKANATNLQVKLKNLGYSAIIKTK